MSCSHFLHVNMHFLKFYWPNTGWHTGFLQLTEFLGVFFVNLFNLLSMSRTLACVNGSLTLQNKTSCHMEIYIHLPISYPCLAHVCGPLNAFTDSFYLMKRLSSNEGFFPNLTCHWIDSLMVVAPWWSEFQMNAHSWGHLSTTIITEFIKSRLTIKLYMVIITEFIPFGLTIKLFSNRLLKTE